MVQPIQPQLMQQPQHPVLPAQPPALAPGTLLAGRYLIQGYIGGGGFGHIYKAQDRVLGYRRAVKEAFFRDPQTQRQFRLEAEFILNARHPNLVRGYAVFEQAGRFYLVMDYVDGYTLEEIAIQHIRRTGLPLPEVQVLDWILPICDAVYTLHTQPAPIIHRDVKPANIKLTRQGLPVLIDLGLAKLYAQGTQTIGAALAFTPGYAPPEQYQASGATDQRTDIYGLGATLFYLLTGYQPTEAPARLSAQALPSLCVLNPVLSPATEQIVLKAMSLDPAERQPDAHTLMRELSAARLALTSPAPPIIQSNPALPAVGVALPVQTPPHYDQTQMCLRCGTANPREARFCLRCGTPFVMEQTEREELPVAPGVRGSARAGAAEGAGTGESSVRVRRARVQRREDERETGERIDVPERADLPSLSHQQHAHLLAPPPNRAQRQTSRNPRRMPPMLDRSQEQGTYAAAAVVAPLFDGLARVLPVRYRKVPHSLARRLIPQPLTYQHEILAVTAAILALTSASLSFAAILAPWMLFFALPALILAVWSLFRQTTNTPADFTRLAFVVLGVSFLWPLLWYLATHHL